jgi:hypothetical protein
MEFCFSFIGSTRSARAVLKKVLPTTWKNGFLKKEVYQGARSEMRFYAVCQLLFSPKHSSWALFSRPLKIRPILLEKTEIFINLTGRSI